MSGQSELDSRAIVIAAETAGQLTRHLDECDRRAKEQSAIWREVREEMRSSRAELGGSITRVYNRLDELKTATADWRLRFAAGMIAVLLAVIGALLYGAPWQ